MLELVFVIVVLGILAAMAIPRMDRDLRQGAKDNILAAISLTQHIALVDNKTNPTDNNWQANLWKISFQPDGSYYTVSTGSNFAVDPGNGNLMDGGTNASKNTFIGKKYGVESVSQDCNPIAFDHLGRPFTGTISGSTYAGYMGSDCDITIKFIDDDITDLIITVAPETGYASGN